MVYICLGLSGRIGLVYITRRGQAFVAYPQVGAMREPDIRDRRGEKLYSHVFFCSLRSGIIPFQNVSESDDQQGEKLAGDDFMFTF